MKRLLTFAGLLMALSAGAQQDMENVTIEPLADLDERWSSGFIDGQGFTRAIVAGLSGG